MAEKTFAAFFSYVHDDDANDNGRITKLRQMLEEEVRALSGEEFEIFQDYEDIHWGQKWEERLNGALDGSTFLISIITPRYIRKEFCRKEVIRFLERENKLARNDLVLSIYYIDTDLTAKSDPVVSAISNHQYFDWRDLRHEPHTHPEIGKRLEKMAREIIDAMKRSTRTTKITQLTEKATPVQPSETKISELAILKPPKRVEPTTLIVDQMPMRGDYTQITDAIADAEPGTRILVRPGLYREALVLEKPLEIMGEGQQGEIVVEFSNNDVVRFNTVFGRVVNLTLRQTGREEFYAVNVAQGRLELEGCDITSQSLACIIVSNGADPRVRRNLIHNGAKYGAYVCQFGRGTFENNQIFQNAFGGVVIESEGDPTFRRNQIYSNSWGYVIRNSGRGELEENDIFSNSQSGVVITAQSYPILVRNRIYNNTEVGIYIYDNSGGRFENNDLRGNGSGATYVDESCTYNIQESGNIAEYYQ